MKKQITISVHNGTKVSRAHNMRNRKVTDKEPHIDKNGWYAIWHDEPLRDAYKRLFGKAQEEYNLKQTRNDRRIVDYLSFDLYLVSFCFPTATALIACQFLFCCCR